MCLSLTCVNTFKVQNNYENLGREDDIEKETIEFRIKFILVGLWKKEKKIEFVFTEIWP